MLRDSSAMAEGGAPALQVEIKNGDVIAPFVAMIADECGNRVALADIPIYLV